MRMMLIAMPMMKPISHNPNKPTLLESPTWTIRPTSADDTGDVTSLGDSAPAHPELPLTRLSTILSSLHFHIATGNDFVFSFNSPSPTHLTTSIIMAVPAYSDIAKSANDLLNKDFYHINATTLEFKDTAPNGVAFKVTGKSSHEKATSAAFEGKYTDKPTAISTYICIPYPIPIPIPIPIFNPFCVFCFLSVTLACSFYLTRVTLTQTWNTANVLDTKIEVKDSLAKGLKLEGLLNYLPATAAKGAKFNLHFQQPGFNGRAFFDLLKGPTANVDAVVGHEGFLAGASAGYDVNKAALTAYSAAVGYAHPEYNASLTASDNLSVFAAAYYHKVNSQVEAGAKATWNSKTGNTVGLELAGKYRIDPVSFAKVKVNDRGIAAVAYNVLLRQGVTLGLGGSFDTQKLDQASHKLGASFTFEG
ncbi:Mitochondrial outer membrane protein porin [Emericellopsis cladophorae]|uniref:Mitochondrial outer membrane protein porin n=1 Tax=Emericellopsis cladophorae TaxID=2686198 RepID=A0A9P9Y1C2_9HYPO|nr:Mitochondrial outer membrane protein porin [Emericellopsis cladophorae]KAI6781692.1 Mitochondrial outer membrane protein porin [Emericellopsis cladophorae]